MSILSIVVVLLVMGFVWWLIDVIPSIDGTFKMIAKGVLVFFVVLWLLQQLGVIGPLDQLRIR